MRLAPVGIWDKLGGEEAGKKPVQRFPNSLQYDIALHTPCSSKDCSGIGTRYLTQSQREYHNDAPSSWTGYQPAQPDRSGKLQALYPAAIPPPEDQQRKKKAKCKWQQQQQQESTALHARQAPPCHYNAKYTDALANFLGHRFPRPTARRSPPAPPIPFHPLHHR